MEISYGILYGNWPMFHSKHLLKLIRNQEGLSIENGHFPYRDP